MLSRSGKGFGHDKFQLLISSVEKSEAFSTGLISDILDVELYVDKVGVDIISDLVTNLIQDVLSEYTEDLINELSMADKLRNVSTHYWDQVNKEWKYKDMPMVVFSEELGAKEYDYLLVPQGFTADKKQKERIVDDIFEHYVYGLYYNRVFEDREKYDTYIYKTKNKEGIHRKQVARLINEEFGKGSAREGNGYLTAKGLLDLIKKYPEIKDFIEREVKR